MNKELKFWPWMWSENKFKVMVPLFLIVVSLINIFNKNYDTGFLFLYGLTIISIIVVQAGITNHWKTLKKLQQQGNL